ncbi:MAG: carboxymuconolactone decarboxylase family protein [Myxococcota bacterium]
MSIEPRHPWLDGRFAPVATLSDDERLLTFVAAHTAAGDLEALQRAWRALAPTMQTLGIEVILQTHLFAGYPRTINALGAVRPLTKALSTASVWESRGEATWRAEGTRLCHAIYGASYGPLRRRISELHVDLDRWMVEVGYGRVLSRPGPTARVRELCVLAVLAGQNVAPQLRSHIQGAFNVGASRADCEAVLAQTALLWGEAAQQQVDAVWRALAH